MLRPFASLAVAFLVVAWGPLGAAQALELKNVRASFGPVGPARADLRCLPGDIVFFCYDIEGLAVDPKTGEAAFETLLEVFDASAKPLFQPPPKPSRVVPHLGGNRVPGDLHVIMGRNQTPGKYTVRLSVKDTTSKVTKSFVQTVELLPKAFGFVGLNAPAVALPGQPYFFTLGISDPTVDAKGAPNAKIEMRVLDAAAKVVSPTLRHEYPQELPDAVDLKRDALIPVQFTIFPNRPGRFTVEMVATDNLGRRTAALRFPLVVLDVANLAGPGTSP